MPAFGSGFLPLLLIRYSVVAVPFFLNGAIIDFDLLKATWFEILLSVLVMGVSLLILYLFAFNRKTKQSLHDLIAGSYVISANNYDAFADNLVRLLISNYPAASSKDKINISLSYGCDIGIASMWKSKSYRKTPNEWLNHSGAV